MTEVWAGPDDFAFERDRYLWRMWIKQNVTTIGFKVSGCEDDAFKAIVTFDDSQMELIFQLTAPEYIQPHLVEANEPWILGADGP